MTRSRAKIKGRRDEGRFILLPVAVIESAAWRALTPRAAKLLIEIATLFRGRNNGDLAYPWRTAATNGWNSKDSLHRAKLELISLGFLVETVVYGLMCKFLDCGSGHGMREIVEINPNPLRGTIP